MSDLKPGLLAELLASLPQEERPAVAAELEAARRDGAGGLEGRLRTEAKRLVEELNVAVFAVSGRIDRGA